jgi:hypothetical protein
MEPLVGLRSCRPMHGTHTTQLRDLSEATRLIYAAARTSIYRKHSIAVHSLALSCDVALKAWLLGFWLPLS